MTAFERRVAAVELVTAQLFIMFLAAGVTLIGAVASLQAWIYLQRDVSRLAAATFTVVWATVAAGEWASLAFYSRAVRRAGAAHPVDVALQQRQLPVVARPLVSVWWLANASFLLYYAHQTVAQYGRYNTDAAGNVLRYACTFVLLLGSAHVACLFVLLSVTALARREVIVRRLWHARILFDFAVAYGLTRLPAIEFDLWRFSWKVASPV